MTDIATEPAPTTEPIIARAGTYYRNMRYLMCVFLIGMGCWFAYDGFVNYPKENDLIHSLNDQRDQAIAANNRTQSEQLLQQLNQHHGGKPHSPADLLIQRAIGIVLPPLGVFVVVWALYQSRGEYRYENGVITVPGHPPVPVTNVKEVDRRLWDRKGIAYVTYQNDDGSTGTFKLDDFVYERKGTDAIYDQLPKQFEALTTNP